LNIEKELIENAKEKLGIKNAEWIAELLELEDFDSKNLKSRCPYHNESTPSFVYNKKTYSFKCFGGSCGKNVDIIDVLMEKGNTFLGAIQLLFEKAGIDYSFGEANVKTKSQYKYPKEVVCNNKDKVYEYFIDFTLSPS
jgi:DNA primase